MVRTKIIMDFSTKHNSFFKNTIFLLELISITSTVFSMSVPYNNDTVTEFIASGNEFNKNIWTENTFSDESCYFINDEICRFLDDYLDKFTNWTQNNFDEVSGRPKRETFSNANVTNYESGLDKLKVDEFIEEVTNLRQHLTLNTTEHAILGEYESHMLDVKGLLQNIRQNFTNKLNEAKKKVLIFTDLMNQFENELNYHINIIQKQKEEIIRHLLDECVIDIKSYHFTVAGEKLFEINYVGKMSYIVEKVYNNRPENFYTLFKFGESFEYLNNTLLFYRTLYDKINSSNHEDLSKQLQLIRYLQAKLTDQDGEIAEQHNNDVIKHHLESFLDTLKTSAKKTAIEMITDAFLLDQLSKFEPYVTQMNETLFQNEGTMNELIEPILERVSEKLNTNDLTTFTRLGKGLCLDGNSVIPLALRIETLKGWSDYSILRPDIKFKMEEIVNSLPTSIKNILTLSSKVCIKNTLNDEYLYALDCSTHDCPQCYVHTKNANSVSRPDELAWKLEPIDIRKYQYRLLNYNYNSALTASQENYDPERRYSSSLANPTVNETEADRWQFELDGNDVYILNSYFNEYLFADAYRFTGDSFRRRYVFTFANHQKVPDARWEIVSCP